MIIECKECSMLTEHLTNEKNEWYCTICSEKKQDITDILLKNGRVLLVGKEHSISRSKK